MIDDIVDSFTIYEKIIHARASKARCGTYTGRTRVIWNVRYITAQSLENTGKERGRRGGRGHCGKNEIRFYHRMFAAASLGIPNWDILILNFRRGETKNGGLRRRSHVEQEIGGGGVPRIGRQFVLEFSQWDHVHRLIVAL